MKNQNKNSKKCYCNKHDTLYKSLRRKTFKLNNKVWEIIYNIKTRKYQLRNRNLFMKSTFDEYIIYSVLNTDVNMSQGVAASTIALSILALYNQLIVDRAKNLYIKQWQKSGENIIVLRGYNHKHLRYLEREAEFVALGKHALYHRWYQNRLILALSVFGRKTELEDLFDGLYQL